MGSSIKSGLEAKSRLIFAINKMADAVTSTLGPGGRNVMIDTGGMDGIHITKDGVTVARSIYFKDPVENMAAQLLKSVSNGSDANVGDGTTTSVLLAQSMIKNGFSVMDNVTSIHGFMKGMEIAKANILNLFEKHRCIIDYDSNNGKDMLRNISMISSNNDKEITDAVMKGLEMVGKEGVFKIWDSGTHQTIVEKKEGMHYYNGMVSPYFANNKAKVMWEYDNVDILIYGGKLERFKQIETIMRTKFMGDGSNDNAIMIIANEYSDEFTNTAVENFVYNKIPIVLVNAPGYGLEQKSYLEDIAVMTGGTSIMPEKNMKIETCGIEVLGRASRVETGMKSMIIMGGKGKPEDIEARRLELKMLEENETDQYYKNRYNERYAKFTNGIALIKLGAYSEVELQEKKFRMEDALKAVKNAIINGYLPGGGFMFWYANVHPDILTFKSDDKNIMYGYGTVVSSLFDHPKKLFDNVGLNFDDYVRGYATMDGKYLGINLETLENVDLIKNGIIDPYMVAVSALNYAVSVTKTILTTEAVIYEDVEVDPKRELGILQP
jgi:chaperonin GroEL